MRVAAAGLLIVCSSCVFGGSSLTPEEELQGLAAAGTEATFAATYRYSEQGTFSAGQATALEIVQDPPRSVRKLETSTTAADDSVITVRSWQAKSLDGDFSCAAYDDGVRCLPNPISTGMFGTNKIDDFFRRPLQPEAFATVERTNRSARVATETGTCFEAIPRVDDDPTETPVAERNRYELCYASDGILLRGRLTVSGRTEGATGTSQRLVELVSLSRIVEARELRLPGAVAEPDELRP